MSASRPSAGAPKGMIGPVIAVAAATAVSVGLILWRPSGLYLWIEAIHVIAVISWMAGLLYLPRLFIYHCEAEPGSRQSETFKLMEHRLLVYIMNPALVLSWGLGLWLIWDGLDLTARWLQAKLVLAVLLTGVHWLCIRWTRDFAQDRNRHGHVFYRVINEVPTVLMIGIVILVVVKPF